MKWILNHLRAFVAIVAFGITFVIVGIVMLSSYVNYKNEEKAYYQRDLDVRSVAAAAPTSIDINDEFVTYNNDGSIKKSASSLKKNLTAWAEDLKVSKTTAVVQGETIVDSYLPALSSGGKVTLTLNLEEKAFVDIDFVISSNYKEDNKVVTTKKILSNVYFKVNDQQMDENVDLEYVEGESNWHHLVMSNFALPAGKIKIEISNMSKKEAYMPNIRNISFFSSQPISF